MVETDWRAWCRSARDIEVDGESAIVNIADGRKHRVTVTLADETYELLGVVARPAVVASLPMLALRAQRRNRSSRMVGFRIDAKERLVAEAWVPKAGVTGAEFIASLRHLAAEADLFEYQLTGSDRE
jgi:hypothetical protein